MLDLKNKRIIILGGSGLIGSAIVQKLLKLQSKIFILDKKKSTISLGKFKEIKFYKYDMTSKSFDKIFTQILHKIGGVDCFINCAYPYTKDWSNSSFDKLKYSSLNKNINYQLENSIWITNLISKFMIKNNNVGSIVLLNSIYGILGNDLNIYKKTTMTENITYSLVKGAISNYVRVMCPLLSKNKIRINSVCAGGVLGPVAGKSKKQSSVFIKNYSNKVPINRLADPEEIASPVIFLCSEMSSYITGSNLIVDGGWSAI